MTALLLVGGLLCLLIGGEALVRGAVAIGRRIGLSPLLVGMVIVGFGTSMPELVVSVRATTAGTPGLAVGNVIGSNISNILLILAVAAVVRPIGRPPRLLVPDGLVLIAVTAGVLLIATLGIIRAWQGAIMVGLLVGLIGAEYLRVRRAGRQKSLEEAPVPLPTELPQRPAVALLLIVAGFAGLVGGAEFFVDGATRTARYLGVSEGLIGLTIVALGTSLPELASATVASWRGHSDVAYGNVIGSNLFNLLGILGCAAIAGELTVPERLVWIDGPVMLIATLAMLYFVFSGARLSRTEGVVMIGAYIVYVAVRYAMALG